MERQRQASIDLMNSRKKKYVKNAFNKAAALAAVHSNGNGTSNVNATTAAYDVSSANQAANYYPFYASSPNTKYYSTSPPQIQQQPTNSSSGLYSPSRMSPYRNNFNSNTSYMSVSKSMIRNLRTSFDSIGASLQHEPAYPQVPDRFHWMNKSIVKA